MVRIDEVGEGGDRDWAVGREDLMMNFTIMKALNIKEFNGMIVDDNGDTLNDIR